VTDRFDRMAERARLEYEQAKLLVAFAREAPDGVPARRPRPDGRSPEAMRGFPIVGTKGQLARAAAGIGPTDPWRRQRERDYRIRSGQEPAATLSPDQILAKSDHLCYLCGISLTPVTMRTEHIIPLALGGSHTDSNIAAACTPCNSRKGTRFVAFMVASRKPIYL
jgi:hypothetical protein